MSTTPSEAKSERGATPRLARQFVNYSFYRIDRAFRREPLDVQQEAKRKLVEIVDRHQQTTQILTYSTVGLKAGVDFLLWQIGYDLDAMQEMAAEIHRSPIGPFIDLPVNYLAMTKHSQYVREHVHEGQEGRRLKIVPGEAKYLFVYPFVKTRPWYLLPMEERQRIMNEHIAVGHRYPSVRINTTYSFGLDDQEFVVAFESDTPSDFLDLVQELRESESSKYTLRDTPIFTCRKAPLREILDEIS